MSVAELDAEQLFRCGFRLEQVADDVRIAAARTARAYPDDWRGDAGIAYQQRLDETAERVRRMAVAYDAAGALLVGYARAVLDAQEIWRRSESLLAEANAADRAAAANAALQAVPRLAGPGVGEALRAAAYRLQAEAADVEHRAAVMCAGYLDDEAARAPVTSAWRAADRFFGDLAQTGVGMLTGAANLVKDAWRSLPGIGNSRSRHEARHELADSAVAALSVWQIPLAIRDELHDDRPGLAAGELLGVVSPGPLSKLGKHPIHDVRLAHLEAFREADLRAELAGWIAVRQTADEMGPNGVDLRNQEAIGGHALLRHVDVEDEYLFARNDSGVTRAGAFQDLASAQRFVNEVLLHNRDEIAKVYTSGKPVRLFGTFKEPTGRVAVVGERRTVLAYRVRVVLKLKDGEPYVFTAFPEL